MERESTICLFASYGNYDSRMDIVINPTDPINTFCVQCESFKPLKRWHTTSPIIRIEIDNKIISICKKCLDYSFDKYVPNMGKI